jgi:ABC-2 type transport system permease protein
MTNVGVIFKRALWDARTGILGWGIGLGLIALFEVAMFPTIQNAFSNIAELLDNPLYRAFLGESADAAAFATPEGFLAIYMLAFVPLYLAVYMVLLGLGIVSNDEERGRLDVLLGTPIPRWQLVAEKFAAVVVITVLVLLLNGLGAQIGVWLTPEMQSVTIGRMIEANLAMLPISLVMVALTLFLSSLLRSRTLAIGITGAIIIASYFVNNLATIAQDSLGTVRQLSFFNYLSPIETMRNGVMWGDFAMMALIALVLFVLSLVAFQRRDLAV